MICRFLRSLGKRFFGTCLTLAALWITDQLTDVPKYTNYAAVLGLVVIMIAIWGRKRLRAEKYRKLVFQVDSWYLGAIALLILDISTDRQLKVLDRTGVSEFDFVV